MCEKVVENLFFCLLVKIMVWPLASYKLIKWPIVRKRLDSTFTYDFDSIYYCYILCDIANLACVRCSLVSMVFGVTGVLSVNGVWYHWCSFCQWRLVVV